MQSDNKSIFSILEDDFEKTAKKEFNLWLKRNEEYRKHVREISNSLELTGKNRFLPEYTANFWAGKTKGKHRPSTIIVSLNPGFNRERKKELAESNRQVKKWETYCNKRDNQFTSMEKRRSPFFSNWYVLFSGLYGKQSEMTIKSDNYDFFDKNILSLNLFPYHSNQSSQFTVRFTPKNLSLVIHHVSNLLEFINKKNPKDVCIFNGQVWDTLLFTHGLISKSKKGYKKVRLVKAKNGTKHYIKFFKYKNVKCVLLTKFLSSLHYESMNDNKIRTGVANKIKRQYSKAKWCAR